MAPKRKTEDVASGEVAAAVTIPEETKPTGGAEKDKEEKKAAAIVEKMARDARLTLFKNQLANPFHPNEVKWKPQMVKGNRCLAIAYLDARTVMDRLDDTVGVEGWRDEYDFLPGGSVVCRLTLLTPFGMFITKCDVGSPSDQPDPGDRVKAAVSDALKRAAVHFGIGRYLYRLPASWVDFDPVKKMITKLPVLPEWARPKKLGTDVIPYHDPDLEIAEPVTPTAAVTPKGEEKPNPTKKEEKNPDADEREKAERAKAAAESSETRSKEFMSARLKWWKEAIEGCGSPAQFTELIAENLKDEPAKSKDRVWLYIQEWIAYLEWKWNKDRKEVYDPNDNGQKAIPY